MTAGGFGPSYFRQRSGPRHCWVAGVQRRFNAPIGGCRYGVFRERMRLISRVANSTLLRSGPHFRRRYWQCSYYSSELLLSLRRCGAAHCDEFDRARLGLPLSALKHKHSDVRHFERILTLEGSESSGDLASCVVSSAALSLVSAVHAFRVQS
jgi:hypothetical protein